jgi:hypothetical protein
MTVLRSIRVPALVILAGTAFLAMAAASQDGSGNLTPYLSHSSPGEKSPDERGFIQRWVLLEPIRQPSLRSNQQLTDSFVQASVKKEYFPDQLSVVPRDGDKVTVDGTELKWYAIDSGKYDVNLFCFARALGKPTYNVLFWAVTTINCPEEMRDVRLSVGSNSASIWWVNGKEVIAIYGDRHMMLNDGISKRLTLKKGPNVVRCAVINAPGLSAFNARFLDKDEKPIRGFTISAGDVKQP